jgi:hypothetical protein
MGRKRLTTFGVVSSVAVAAWLLVATLAPAAQELPLVGPSAAAVLLAATSVAAIGGGRFRAEASARKREWQALQHEWSVAPDGSRPTELRAQLDTLKAAYDALLADRAAKLSALQANRRATQLREHLDRFQIAGAGIKGVGDSKAAILQSAGIETAADVVEWRILQVNGFGPKTTANLVAWRRAKEASFRFDPNKPISPGEVSTIENAAAVKRRELELRVSAGLAGLRNAVAAETRARSNLAARHAELGPAYAQAVANARAALLLV